MLDGAARLKDCSPRHSRLGCRAIAMTDHGNMYGAVEFYKAGKRPGVTPIIGIEAYVAPESRRHQAGSCGATRTRRRDDVSGGGAYTHKTIWPQKRTGLHNLFRLSSRASLEG